jgi:hypothetical protein
MRAEKGGLVHRKIEPQTAGGIRAANSAAGDLRAETIRWRIRQLWRELEELSRGASHYVDKILNGAKPADLPVEQPTK